MNQFEEFALPPPPESLLREQCRNDQPLTRPAKRRYIPKAVKRAALVETTAKPYAKYGKANATAPATVTNSSLISEITDKSFKTTCSPMCRENCGGVCSSYDYYRYNVSSITDQHRWNVLAKIVLHLKDRQLRRDNTPLTIDEILDETRQLHVMNSTKRWLVNEGLPANPKVEVVANGTKFKFKPTYKLSDGKSMMRLLKHFDLKGLGGILADDLYESLPNCQKYFNKYADDIICIERTTDKRKVYFYKDKSQELGIDEDFKKLWRSIHLDSIDNEDLVDELEAMKPPPKPKARRKRKVPLKLDNKHVSDILEDYSEQ